MTLAKKNYNQWNNIQEIRKGSVTKKKNEKGIKVGKSKVGIHLFCELEQKEF